MASVKKKIVRNTLASSFLKAWTYLINFFLFPFIVKYVGLEEYGIYLLVGAFVGYFGLLDFGVNKALVKYVAEFNAKDDEETVNRMLNSSFLFYLFIGAVIFILVMIIGTFYVHAFNIDSGNIEKARYIAYLTAIGALTSWPMRTFGAVMPGLQRYDISVIIAFIVSNVTAVATVIILQNGGGILDLIFWGIVIGSVGQLGTVILVQRFLPYLKLRREYMTFTTMKKIFRFSSVIFISQISALLILGTDRIVIGAFVSVGAITLYAIASKLNKLISSVNDLSGSSLLPAATELEALDKQSKLKEMVFRGGKYRCALVLAVTSTIFMLVEPLIRYWMSSDPENLSEYMTMVHPTRVYISYWFIIASTGTIGAVLLAKEIIKEIMIFNILIGISNLALSLVLVQYYGLFGVILGTVIPYLVIQPLWVLYMIKLIEIGYKDYFSKVILPTYPISLLVIAVLWLLLKIHEPTNLITVGLYGLAGVSLYGAVFFKFSMSKREKREMATYIKSILRANRRGRRCQV